MYDRTPIEPADEPGETPENNTPENNTPDDNTPDDNTPDDNTPDDNTPDDDTPNEGEGGPDTESADLLSFEDEPLVPLSASPAASVRTLFHAPAFHAAVTYLGWTPSVKLDVADTLCPAVHTFTVV